MATFKITELIIIGDPGEHNMTDWVIIKNGDRDHPLKEVLNDTENLRELRTPIMENGDYLEDCTGLECIVRMKMGNNWSDEHTLRPIPTTEDI